MTIPTKPRKKYESVSKLQVQEHWWNIVLVFIYIELDITHCGICASELFKYVCCYVIYEYFSANIIALMCWGETDYPCVIGHEITGVVTKVNKNVNHVTVGDRVCVGAQSGSCLDCKFCKHHEENICVGGAVYTYNSCWPNGDFKHLEVMQTSGVVISILFSNYIHKNLSSEIGCTFCCASVTIYSSLKHHDVSKGSKVGVIGIDGLVHYGVSFNRAEVVALSHSDRKWEDAKNLGCDDYITLNDDARFKEYTGKLTHILCTSFAEDFPWNKYLSLLEPNGKFLMIAITYGILHNIPPDLLVAKQTLIIDSAIGFADDISGDSTSALLIVYPGAFRLPSPQWSFSTPRLLRTASVDMKISLLTAIFYTASTNPALCEWFDLPVLDPIEAQAWSAAVLSSGLIYRTYSTRWQQKKLEEEKKDQ
ncbi:hypothetical protein INT45_012309 [Circinella minor]|uniref:Uncharacterized protein n=1 Tax=Circinella minor TaxID=1195481 RepID=A0A8H7VJN3_9FUNG|nr:hypothetical protein INT45_012309 [Circinella minor]